MLTSNGLLLEVIGNPTVAYDQKQAMLLELIARTRVSDTTANFFADPFKESTPLEPGRDQCSLCAGFG